MEQRAAVLGIPRVQRFQRVMKPAILRADAPGSATNRTNEASPIAADVRRRICSPVSSIRLLTSAATSRMNYSATVVCTLLVSVLATVAAEAPRVLDSRKQLFLDDDLIASMIRVKRAVEQAEKFSGNPVLWPTERWEPPMAVVYGSILRDGTKFKMWYKSGLGVAYAESDDGVQWNKPRLDLTLVGGERSNILF